MSDLDTIFDFVHTLNTEIEYFIKDSTIKAKAEQLGLDPRCGTAYVFKSGEGIIIPKTRVPQYERYGGFEYVQPKDRLDLPYHVIFIDSNKRVREAIEAFMDR